MKLKIVHHNQESHDKGEEKAIEDIEIRDSSALRVVSNFDPLLVSASFSLVYRWMLTLCTCIRSCVVFVWRRKSLSSKDGLPGPFCKIHLPGNDTEVILEDKSGEEFPIIYISNKTGLSAGWRKFVAGNKLVEGDVLILQLI
ncbi:B3 domain-containing protein-like protein isoform X2 [Salvia divinorum]|uniref:B3 domain-containing protein-like protein isoform X2 n=1 Tax=Salvia divinorum TaxID=28513 RepID=A0ABD1G085_SALDI